MGVGAVDPIDMSANKLGKPERKKQGSIYLITSPLPYSFHKTCFANRDISKIPSPYPSLNDPFAYQNASR